MPYNRYPANTADAYDEYVRTGLRYQKTAVALSDNAGNLDGLRVVDLGCGTGVLTKILASKVGPAGQVFGIDASAEMLTKAKQDAQPNTTYICAPAEELDQQIKQPVDAVFSNAAFWQFDREPTLTAVNRTLAKNGTLHFNLSAGFFNFKASGMHEPADDAYPYKQHKILDEWTRLAHARYPDRNFSAHTAPSPKPPAQSLTELSTQLKTFGFSDIQVKPLRFEIPRDDEYNWLSIPQWTDRTLAPLNQAERIGILDEIFAGIPSDAKFLARWVMISASRK